MELDKNTNYIVSGLERSGTSLIMQMLKAGGIPVAFDNMRPADEHNPKGYFELEGGKIINRLMDGSFPFDKHKGQFIKITAYGLQFLPQGNYKIIYSERNLDEILSSMEKMARINDTNREETKTSFRKLNVLIKRLVTNRDDIQVLFVQYSDVVHHTESEIQKIYDFLGVSELDIHQMIATVDKRLYRQRQTPP